MYYITNCPSPVGMLTLACDSDSLIGLWLEGQKYYGAALLEKAQKKDTAPVFAMTKKWLESYFGGEKPGIEQLPLNPIGSEFRRDVWDILCKLSYGEVTTYGNIAKKIAEKMGKKTMSSQAVGGAVGHNPISIIIPCHRVIGSNNSLTGYAGGIAVKIKLLELEGVDISRLSVPKNS